MEKILSISSLDQYYGESHTLNNLSLDMNKGQCTVLMGRNGVGKTTLLQCIMGLLPTVAGEIVFNGENIAGRRPEDRAGLGIGYVPQGRQIFPLLTVEENLRTGLGARKDRIRKIPDSIYELFPVLEEMRSRRGGDLSGGQQQQLAIGRALVIEPSLLILDEPTEGIQPNIVKEIGTVIMKLVSENNISVLLVEQKLPFARRVADQFSIMVRGTMVSGGEIEKLDDKLAVEHLTV